MGIFKRRKDTDTVEPAPSDLATVLLQGEDALRQMEQAHRQWGLGTAERWDLDQTTGTISWTFPDKVATAPAQILGSYNPTAGSWLWAWANPSVVPELSRDSEVVRDWAAAHGHDALTTSEIEADDTLADTLTAIAVRVTRASGFYRGQGASMPVITFGTVTLTPYDGSEPTTFEVGVED